MDEVGQSAVLTPRKHTLASPHFNHLYQQNAINTTPMYWTTNQSNANYVSAASLLSSKGGE